MDSKTSVCFRMCSTFLNRPYSSGSTSPTIWLSSSGDAGEFLLNPQIGLI